MYSMGSPFIIIHFLHTYSLCITKPKAGEIAQLVKALAM